MMMMMSMMMRVMMTVVVMMMVVVVVVVVNDEGEEMIRDEALGGKRDLAMDDACAGSAARVLSGTSLVLCKWPCDIQAFCFLFQPL
jgi:hypothetical protein